MARLNLHETCPGERVLLVLLMLLMLMLLLMPLSTPLMQGLSARTGHGGLATNCNCRGGRCHCGRSIARLPREARQS